MGVEAGDPRVRKEDVKELATCARERTKEEEGRETPASLEESKR